MAIIYPNDNYPNDNYPKEEILKKIGENIYTQRKQYIKEDKIRQKEYKLEQYLKNNPQEGTKEELLKRYQFPLNKKYYPELDQKEVSKKIGKSEKFLLNLKNGKVDDLTIFDLINICNVIHCTPNDILSDWIKTKNN